MLASTRAFRIRLLLASFVLAISSTAFAQTTSVRVVVDRANIWRPGFLTVATVVRTDTVLIVVGRQGNWLQVLLPGTETTDRTIGLIAVAQIAVVEGALPAGGTPSTRTRGRAQPPRPPAPTIGIRAFGDVGYNFALANETFDAILNQPGTPLYGGGAEFRWKDRLLVLGSIRRFHGTGERAFVSDGEVFQLGIEDTITTTPVTFTVGYRTHGPRVTTYGGAGIGRLAFKETSEFADPSEDIDEQFTSYHFLIGAEWRQRSWLATAFEVQFTHVPDALTGALADALNEHNLGGVELRVKLMVGR